ncbi:hypothetical protein V4Y02_23920, partial [Escherichia coli]
MKNIFIDTKIQKGALSLTVKDGGASKMTSPVIPATQGAEAGSLQVRGQLQQFRETLSQNLQRAEDAG